MTMGACERYLRSVRTDRRNRTTLAVDTAANKSNSVELCAVIFYALDLKTTAPPARQMAKPVVDQCLRGSLP